MTYKNSHPTIGEVGKQLGVDYVVEGSVRRDGSKLRVTAQLIEAPNQAHVWAESTSAGRFAWIRSMPWRTPASRNAESAKKRPTQPR